MSGHGYMANEFTQTFRLNGVFRPTHKRVKLWIHNGTSEYDRRAPVKYPAGCTDQWLWLELEVAEHNEVLKSTIDWLIDCWEAVFQLRRLKADKALRTAAAKRLEDATHTTYFAYLHQAQLSAAKHRNYTRERDVSPQRQKPPKKLKKLKTQRTVLHEEKV